MHATADFQLTYGLFRNMVLDSLGNRLRHSRIAGVVVLILAVLLGLVEGFERRNLLILGLGMLLIVFPDLVALLSWIPQRRILTTPFHYEISASGVLVRTSTSRTEVAWPGISRIRVGRHAWLFKHGAAQLPIPRAAFGPEEQRSIDQFLAAHPT